MTPAGVKIWAWALYDAHRLATDPRTGVTGGARRKAEAAPVIDKLYAWIAAERPRVDGDAPIAKAMKLRLEPPRAPDPASSTMGSCGWTKTSPNSSFEGKGRGEELPLPRLR